MPTLILGMMLLYAVASVAPAGALGTESGAQSDPVRRTIWVALLVMALPIANLEWRRIAALARQSWPLLSLHLFFVVSSAWALDVSTSLRRALFALVQVLICLILIGSLKRPAVLLLLIAGACGLMAVADAGAGILDHAHAVMDDGFVGLQSQKNQTGLLMMYGSLSTFAASYLVEDARFRNGLRALVVLMLVLLVATRSTTSQVLTAMALVGMALAMARPRWLLGNIPLLVAGTSTAAILAWLLLPATWINSDYTFTNRTDIWTFLVEEIWQRPWFGAGYGSFWAIDPSLQPSRSSDLWFARMPIINEGHQGYLDLLATVGIVGTVAGLAVFLRAFYLAVRAITRRRQGCGLQNQQLTAPAAAFHAVFLIVLAFHNLTESNLFSNNSLLSVAFLLTALDLERWRLRLKFRQGRSKDVGFAA